VIVGSSLDDWMAIFPLKGVVGEHLRSISLEIYHQKHINDRDLEGIDGFEFKLGYKYNIPLYIQTPYFLKTCFQLLHQNTCYMSGGAWK